MQYRRPLAPGPLAPFPIDDCPHGRLVPSNMINEQHRVKHKRFIYYSCHIFNIEQYIRDWAKGVILILSSSNHSMLPDNKVKRRLTVRAGLHLTESKPLSISVNDFTPLTTHQIRPSPPAEAALSEGQTNLQTASVTMGPFLKIPLRPLTQFHV